MTSKLQSGVDPDDLFVKFTIPEIRNVQAKLRGEADAKQEELRLMVGERYRDLLQASTSIISIADSSKRVMGALTEMRQAMVSEEDELKPRRSSIRGKDDAHLKMLQTLSAHLKLLLDAPEHLWRLLERKQHLPAAWLFLLARIVHRALVTTDPEENWDHEGINVLSQFPLVQRQWETVAQFRSQIAHRATQYLREHSISSETACSTILTLHLLDSLPLHETLSILLSQRSRILNTLFAHNLDSRSQSRPGSPILKTHRKNREVSSRSLSSLGPTSQKTSQNRKDIANDVQLAVLELLDVICGTMRIARDVFCSAGDRKSLVERSLEDIQSDTPSSSVLTTSSLLSTLPSSTHLLTLPRSILSYKPYIDLTSPSTHVNSATLDSKLSTWFDKMMQGFEGRIHTWFEGLETIREVWGVRRKVLKRLQMTRGLEDRERTKVRVALDEGVNDRVGEVTRASLRNVEESVEKALKAILQEVRDEIEETRLDVSPSKFLFSPPPIPFVSQLSTNAGLTMASFKSFKGALRQRAEGRTPSLDKLLNDLESKARELEEDLDVLNQDDHVSRELRQQVMRNHYPASQASLNRIVQTLERLVSAESDRAEGPAKTSIVIVIFLGRISHALSASPFGHSLHCQDDSLRGHLPPLQIDVLLTDPSPDFRSALEVLHERSLDHWRTHTVSKALELYAPLFAVDNTSAPSADKELTWPHEPTPYLIHSLLSITSSLQLLGLPLAELHSKRVSTTVVRDFKTSIAREISIEGQVWRQDQAQILWDLTFLRRLPHAHCGSFDAEDPLSTKAKLLQSHLCLSAPDETLPKFSAHVDRTIDQYLPRCQTLLATLISAASSTKKSAVNGNSGEGAPPPVVKATALLPLGAPVADQDFKPAIDIVKPSARFGLLLVGSTALR